MTIDHVEWYLSVLCDAHTKVVLDTNVVVDHILAQDERCSQVVNRVKQRRNTVVVCEKLLREYRDALVGNQQQMNAVINLILIQMLPVELLESHRDPTIRIQFGPEHDRFHMQLAINARSDCHITKDGAVLAERAKMSEFGVREVHPASCTSCQGR